MFNRGDILTINFWTKTILYHFEGICLSLKNKFFLKPNISIILRNILFSIGIEMSVSYYYNRLFKNIFMSDYKRKKFKYRASKLYYLRLKKNKLSKIKN
jgi:ribosomal protein L19